MFCFVVTGLVSGRASWKLRALSSLASAVTIKSVDSGEKSLGNTSPLVVDSIVAPSPGHQSL